MGCGSCSSQGCAPAGCKGNGGCSTGGCNKMNSYDWLQDMEDPMFFPKFDIVEVRFKGGRKEYFRNKQNLELVIGDAVLVEVQGGKHMGYVSLTGELVRLQLRKKKVDEEEIKSIIRIANEKDQEKAAKARDREGSTIYKAREIVREKELKMKLSDVEYQADNTKAIFFYSADERVDFRELIKGLAEEFKIRVEMKQISLRHEAARLGGIGSCGRELCCSTWLTDFKSVGTQAARYQNLSINPQKLSGQCGRLKCCLNYELDTYKNALKGIPEVKAPLKTTAGDAKLVKTDIFKRLMWFSLPEDSDWKPLSVKEVLKIQELNKKGQKAEFREQTVQKKVVDLVDETVNLEGSLARMDRKSKKRSNSRNRNRNRNHRPENKTNKSNSNNSNRPAKKPEGGAPNNAKKVANKPTNRQPNPTKNTGSKNRSRNNNRNRSVKKDEKK